MYLSDEFIDSFINQLENIIKNIIEFKLDKYKNMDYRELGIVNDKFIKVIREVLSQTKIEYDIENMKLGEDIYNIGIIMKLKSAVLKDSDFIFVKNIYVLSECDDVVMLTGVSTLTDNVICHLSSNMKYELIFDKFRKDFVENTNDITDSALENYIDEIGIVVAFANEYTKNK